jgi:cytochrome c
MISSWKRLCRGAMLVASVALASAAQAAGNAGNGATVFNRCAICHDKTKGGPNKIGPELFGVVGRKAGTYPGFSYSGAMQRAGFTWTSDRLDAYIASPATVVPDNKMPFAGISNAGQRADLIAFLETLK